MSPDGRGLATPPPFGSSRLCRKTRPPRALGAHAAAAATRTARHHGRQDGLAGPHQPLRSTLTNNYRSPPVTPSAARGASMEVATPPGLHYDGAADWARPKRAPPDPPALNYLHDGRRNAVLRGGRAACALLCPGGPPPRPKYKW